MSYTKHFNTRTTPQTKPIPGSKQIANSGGGYSYSVSPLEQFKRFLILGAEGGSYYASEQELTIENAKNIVELIKENVGLVKVITEVSASGEAPKFKPLVFALALCSTFGDEDTKREAYAAIRSVCRTGTQLFYFCQCIQDLRGWSRGLRTGVAKYYTERHEDNLALQLIKYRQRDGWTHKDVIRLAHPATKDKKLNKLLKYAVDKGKAGNDLVTAFEDAQASASVKKTVELITEYPLPWEALPTEMLKKPEIWEALLPKMGMTALLRNLARMTSIGLIDSGTSAATKTIIKRLTSEQEIKGSKLHPLVVLNGMRVYAQGHGDKGKLNWSPVSRIVDSLNDAFYKAFKNVEPTEKATMIGLDVSGSMHGSQIAGMALSAREASVALAMVTARTEPFYDMVAFSNGLTRLSFSPAQRLDDLIRLTGDLPFSNTDCALPILAALHNKLKINTFIIYTDNETNGSSMHPKQAMDQYRQKTGINAKLIVVGMTSNGFTIADPEDRDMLDVVGFSTATPKLIADFSRGDI